MGTLELILAVIGAIALGILTCYIAGKLMDLFDYFRLQDNNMELNKIRINHLENTLYQLERALLIAGKKNKKGRGTSK